MISVVIPSLHSPLIDQVIRALDQQTARDQIREVIVVGQDHYGRVPPHARFIAIPQPLSAAAARNLGAGQATGDYVLFLDSDCIAAPDLAEHVLACHRQGHAVVGGSVAIEANDYWVLCDNLLVFAPFLATAPAGERAYLPSLNLSIARWLFRQAGGFDEHFSGAAGEDIDLSLRLRQRGHALLFEPRAVVYHRPQRASARSVFAHLRGFGRVQLGLQQVYGLLAAPRLNPQLRPWAGVILASAPLLAVWDVVGMCRSEPSLRPHWRALPGMTWGKLGWYIGVVESLLVHIPQPAWESCER